MTLSKAAGVLEGKLWGKDISFRGAGLDSRRMQPGQLFVALPGKHHDGHDFVAAARHNGAAAALVNRPVAVDLPQLVAPDTEQAMGSLARAWSKQFHIPLAAVTGSISKTLATIRPVKGRLQLRRGINDARLIDDSYNANPSLLDAALAVLTGFAGEKVLVLGEMAELGENTVHWHTRAGEAARGAGIDRLYATGELMLHAVRAFGSGASHYSDRQALIDALRPRLAADVTVLVKGSRCTGMEAVAEALSHHGGPMHFHE